MNLQGVKTENSLTQFTMENIELPYVNALRRTILSDISIVGIKGFPQSECDILIHNNDTILHNEIIVT